MVGIDHIIGARLLPRQFQVYFIKPCHIADFLVLEHLQPAAKPDNNAAAHRIGCLPENCERRFGRMGGREQVEQVFQFLLRRMGEQLVDLFHGFPPLRVAPFHIQNQSLEEIRFRAVPEVVAPFIPGILDNNVAEKLGHQFVTFNFRKAGPGVRVLRGYQVEHPDGIALFPQILACCFVQFGFGITDNQGFPLCRRLKDAVDAVGPGLHRTAGTVYGDIPVEPAFFRHTDVFTVQRAENGAGMLFQAGG